MEKTAIQKAKTYIKEHKVSIALGVVGSATIAYLLHSINAKHEGFLVGMGAITALNWANRTFPDAKVNETFKSRFGELGDIAENFTLPS